MRASLKNINYTSVINSKHRKEKGFFRQLTVVTNDFKQPVIARFYPTGQRVYCCLWIHSTVACCSASDYAGGGGYHKPSAALAGAIDKLNIELSEPIDGRGDSAMFEALTAIAESIGFKKISVVEAFA